MRRRLVLLALAVILLDGCGGSSASPSLRGNVLRPSFPAPAFALHDQDGRLVTLAGQRGRPVVLAFLYTRCPDVCPLIAGSLNEALQSLRGARDRVRVLAISVDPAGDTRSLVRRFIREHRLLPEFRYLTGTRAQLAPVWAAYHIAVTPGRLDTVDHSAYELLVDKRGAARATYDAQVQPGDVAHDLCALLHSS